MNQALAKTGAADLYWNLVVAARADGAIQPDEEAELAARAAKLDLAPETARAIRDEVAAQSTIRLKMPADDHRRWQSLIGMLDVVAADRRVAPQELAVVRQFARRFRIDDARLEALVGSAMQRSETKRTKAYASFAKTIDIAPASAGDSGAADLVDLEPTNPSAIPPPLPRREALRSLPLANRFAPKVRPCLRCRRSFADDNPYEKYCRICQRSSASAPDASFTVLWIVCFIGVAVLLEYPFGLWSWAIAEDAASHSTVGYRGRRRSALGMPVVLAGVISYGIGWIIFQLWHSEKR